MSLININNLTFAYPGNYDNIFEDVSLQIDTQWKLGFTGRNGRGKTTFLKLLMGEYSHGGSINALVNFDYFPFTIEDERADTIKVINTITPDFPLWQLEKELALLKVESEVLYRPFSTLSQGEQTKVLLAVLFLKPNNFLLIDEPTNHLDAQGRELVANYLKSKTGFILVSHDRIFLDKVIDHILAINKTDIQVQKGNFSTWYQNTKAREYFERGQNEKLQKEIGHLNAAAKRCSNWSDKVEKSKGKRVSGIKPDSGYIGHKSAKMMKRAKIATERREKTTVEKSKLLQNLETAEDILVKPLTYHNAKLIELYNVSVAYGDKKVCQHISLTVNQGDRIALQGPNGCGKSTILKVLMGEDITYSGEVFRGSNLKISYVPQDTSFLRGNLRDYAAATDIDETLFKTILRKFDFSRLQFEKDMAAFSQGQKKKVLMAASLCSQSHLYIWDEPLNFIDVLSRIQIENLITTYNLTMVFVDHDQAFTEAVATDIIKL